MGYPTGKLERIPVMLYKRGNTYYTRFTARGQRVHKSCRTASRAKAEQYETRLKAALWEQQHLGKEVSRLWQDAVESWLAISLQKRSLDDDLLKLEWLGLHLNDVKLADISKERIESILDKRTMSNSTRNKWYSVIRTVLARGQELGWCKPPELPNLPETEHTPRFLSQDEASALIAALDTPRRKHLQDMVRFSLATGLRESNVTGLLWSRVNLAHKFLWIDSGSAKGKRTLRIPLNSTAIEILKGRQFIHQTHVFTYRGQPVRKANRDGFQAALKEAKIRNFRWHDLRHTFASWHVMAGTPLKVLQELGGWTSIQMVMRYAHLSPNFADSFVENVAQNVTQAENGEGKTAVSS